MHEKCYLGDLRDGIGLYLHILVQKGLLILVAEVILPEPQIMFLKPAYQRQQDEMLLDFILQVVCLTNVWDFFFSQE